MQAANVESAVTATQLVRDFPQVRSMAENGPVNITSHGRTELVMLNPESYATMALCSGPDASVFDGNLSFILDSINTAVLIMDESLHIVGVNKTLHEAIGFDREILIGKHVSFLADTASGMFLVDRFAEVLRSGQPETLVMPTATRPGQTALMNIKPWQGGVVLFSEDVTERTKLRDRIVSEHAIDISLGGIQGLGIAYVQSSGEILSASLGLAHMTGSGAATLRGARFQTLLDPRQRSLIDDALNETLSQPKRFEVSYLRDGTTVTPASLMVTPYWTAEYRACAALVLHDPLWAANMQSDEAIKRGPQKKAAPQRHSGVETHS